MQYADKGTRVGNIIIDLATSCVLSYCIAYILYLCQEIQHEYIYETLYDLFFIIAFFYYLIYETINGQTLGKAITQTKVVSKDGSKPSFFKILGRSILRFFPINIFVILFGTKPLHDAWTATYVVRK